MKMNKFLDYMIVLESGFMLGLVALGVTEDFKKGAEAFDYR